MLRTFGLVSSILVAVACGESLAAEEAHAVDAAPLAAAPALPAVPAAPAAALGGAVTGTVRLQGEAPPPERVDLSPDPVCVGLHPEGMTRQRVVVSASKGLADVFVQLTGLPDARYETPETPVVLDQRGCTYHPHVFGVMKKQSIQILNSDDTLHNIHAVPKDNKEFNVGMPTKGMSVEKDFKKAEAAITIKCDVHAWMLCYAFSMEHPYFAVSDAEGRFSIDTGELPNGEYGIRLWHEVLGTQDGKVTLANGAATYDFAFKK